MTRENGVPGESCGGGGGGGSTPSCITLADQVFELSSRLGALRQRSAANVEALRCAAEGVPELKQAFRPLEEALEAGLIECHQADVAAVFGRPAPASRGLLNTLPVVRNGDGVVDSSSGGGVGTRRGGTVAAAQHLARAISALDIDVQAAAVMAKHSESFRAIARWAARQSTTTAATAQPPPASALALSRTMYAGGSGSSRGDGRPAASSEEITERYDPSEDWILKVFRRHTTGLTYRTIDGKGGEVGDSSSSSSGGERSRLVPLVVIKALRVPLAPVDAGNSVSPVTSTKIGRLPECENGAGTGSGGRGEGGGAWRNPLSWLTGSLRPVPPPAGPHPPPPPPRPCTAPPPRVIVRVVYAADASDMIERLVMTTEGRDDELVRGREASDDTVMGSGGGHCRGEDKVQGCRKVAGSSASGKRTGSSVQLLRSEVRVRHGCSGEGARVGRGEGVTPAGSAEGGPGSACAPGIQLQVVLQLRTPTPVVVSRLLHSGGKPLLPRPPPPPPQHLSSSRPLRGTRRLSTRSSASAVSASPSTAAIPGRRGESGCNNAAQAERNGSRRDGPDGGGKAIAGGGVVLDGADGAACGGGRGPASERCCSAGGCGDSSRSSGNGVCVECGGVEEEEEEEEEEGRDVVPLGWGEAPAELRPPEGFAEGRCELKIGTHHLLGINIVLPSPVPASTLERISRGRPPGANVRVPSQNMPPPLPRCSRRPDEAPTTSMVLSPQVPRSAAGDGNGGGDDDHDDHHHGDGNAWGGDLARPVVHQTLQQRRRQQKPQCTGTGEAERAAWSSGKKRPRPEFGGDEMMNVRRLVRREKDGAGSSRRLGGEGRGSVVARDAAAGSVHARACGGNCDGGVRCQDENHNEGRASKRRRKTGWGWGFLRLWGRAEMNEGEGDDGEEGDAGATTTVPSADGSASTPEASRNQAEQFRRKQSRRIKPAAASDAERQQPGFGHAGSGLDGDEGFGAPRRQDRQGDINASQGEANAASSSSSSSHERGENGRDGGCGLPAAPLRRSPLLITVVLAPPPPPPPPPPNDPPLSEENRR